MIAVGNNTLGLCPKALCLIVERHLNLSQPTRDGGPLRVTAVQFNDRDGFKFSITTDPEVKQ